MLREFTPTGNHHVRAWHATVDDADRFSDPKELITAAGSQWMNTGAWLESRIAEAASSGMILEAPVRAREDRPPVMERERGGEDS